jgi:hypothetical protein
MLDDSNRRKPSSRSANAEGREVVAVLLLSRLKRDGNAVGLEVDGVALEDC